ncbi:hypothetical protein [Spirosoma gilvum]
MKYLLYIVLIVLTLIPSTSQAQAQIRAYWGSAIPVAKKHDLKGNVKTITQAQSPITNKPADWLDGYSGKNYTEEYNKQGFLQKRTSSDDYNKPQVATHYAYSSRGHISAIWDEILAQKSRMPLSEGRISYEFNPTRKLYIIRDKRIIGGIPLNTRTEMRMDSVSRIAVKRTYKQDTLLITEERYTWDKPGYLTGQIVRRRKQVFKMPKVDQAELDAFMGEITSNLSEAEKAAYKAEVAKGRIQMMNREDSLKRVEDSLYALQPEWSVDTTLYQNQYDNQSRLLRQKTYNHHQLTDVYSFSYTPETTRRVVQSYDRSGNLVSETISLQHPVKGYILSDTSRYNYTGKWEEHVFDYTNMTKPIYQYQYDKHGNWVEQKQVDANGMQIGSALVRKIEYYP